MKAQFVFLLIFSQLFFSEIKLEDLDFLRSLSKADGKSIISSGTSHCNDFFDRKNLTVDYQKYKNFFICKFSKQRNRFYIYMLAVDKKNKGNLKEFCTNIMKNWMVITDHIDKKFMSQKQQYLNGFFVDNLFNDNILNFSKNFNYDQRLINNEIDKFILENRDIFTNDNEKNNQLVEREIKKISNIYRKIINDEVSDLDKVIKNQLDKIVRYKIFINDTKNFISYSCNWKPGKGLNPYVKREKFSEFENI